MFFPKKTNWTTSLSPTQRLFCKASLCSESLMIGDPLKLGVGFIGSFVLQESRVTSVWDCAAPLEGRGGGLERSLCCVINPNYISKQINPIRCCGGGSAPANQSTLGIIHGREVVVVVVVGQGVEGRGGRVVHFSLEMLPRSTKTPPTQPALRTRPVLFRPPLTVDGPAGYNSRRGPGRQWWRWARWSARG